jgi:dTDP-4-dehydrorhamnose 3,5-epimerase
MKFSETALAGAYVIDLEPIVDRRGSFARVWCEREFADAGLSTKIAQVSVSYNAFKGTLRGLHYQGAPHEEVKLVRCTRGRIYDVIVDLRPESPTFLHWIAVELGGENQNCMVYVPERFAHGFQTLEDDTEVLYQVSEFYAPDSAKGIRYDDPRLGVEWPLPVSAISDRDASWADLRCESRDENGRTDNLGAVGGNS